MATNDPISALVALGAAPATNDLLVLVDISDPTQAASGSTKRMTVANLFASPTFLTPTFTGEVTAPSVQIGAGSYKWGEPAVRSWSARVLSGNLSIASGDGLGNVVFGTAGISVSAIICTGTIASASAITATGNITAGGNLTAAVDIVSNGTLRVVGGFGCNGSSAQTAYASGGAAPAGGTGTLAGAYDTSVHRDALITLVNNMRTALVNAGIMT